MTICRGRVTRSFEGSLFSLFLCVFFSLILFFSFAFSLACSLYLSYSFFSVSPSLYLHVSFFIYYSLSSLSLFLSLSLPLSLSPPPPLLSLSRSSLVVIDSRKSNLVRTPRMALHCLVGDYSLQCVSCQAIIKLTNRSTSLLAN